MSNVCYKKKREWIGLDWKLIENKRSNLPDKVVAHTSIRLSSADVAEAAVAPNMSPAVAKVAQILAPGGICLIHSSGRTF